ncbi:MULTISPECIES: TetR/AcrR family transcriptional regulator [unclassified Diaminobutyricimonas]|uniref:TetR/AcrR family transcriptional regulator n=1 Tax=unclassified Diaminobutyricimonas TaxID=2643261 RepID=UPI0012F4829D|nr:MULTISPECIES: TetR/AcrR family transcriptional regulator [unclassified Diaminobutyricimonas]
MQQVDGRRARGDESRRVALASAVDLASVSGLEGLSIGGLAGTIGASKSGVAALFGSKEQLQLAVVAAAREIFMATVIEPARVQPRGIRRLTALVQLWLDYSSGRTFPGGCFFLAAAAEYDSKPGLLRDAVAAALAEWDGYLTASIRFAIELGELPGLKDPEQLTFELRALAAEANSRSLLQDSDVPYARARAAMAARLQMLGADPVVLEQGGLA